ncbi:DUF2075 domain-containing protein [Candidatus Absconditicoccus praedator]|uniref:DUF2075 domain-containing protein n=1 Tax=Candidatus Absconditicoccus praedator TaxID=2735562 RepID=UPI001E5EA112|nr:DUF2075 domain-containing protein [Candidatus Absconditicoccus praedator]UFX83355.1 DUF2075 domain-containing protein [Candidatus Absconditicoccus praedator]
MIVYSETKQTFLDDVSKRNIEDIIETCVENKLKRKTSKNEKLSWKNSLREMFFIMSDNEIPDDIGVSIEYNIPGSGKRIDFIITGLDDSNKENVIIIELKQWEKVQLTDKDGIVTTRFSHGESEENHPSYQAWSYATLLYSFNETVEENDIQLNPCAYLHNYKDNSGDIVHDFYSEYITKSPVFLQDDKEKLQNFIKKYIKHGDKNKTMYEIDQGKIRPSKSLADSLVSMIKGNQEFVMIDDQKLLYEQALKLARNSSQSNKKVLIVRGGPGTGKSVVAINLLVTLNQERLVTQYVSKNSAPRAVYAAKLTGELKKTHIDNLFVGSGSFTNSQESEFDCLIVDEAHRLNEKSGMFGNLGENQIKEIIYASNFSIFFIDEDQKVTFNDIGEVDEIKKRATNQGAEIYEMELSSQFRCSGSDGYLAWLDNTLQIKETANPTLEGINYDFKVFDSPADLRDAIFEKNKINNRARLLAGYCRNWVSKKDSSAYDIVFEEYDFQMKWNLSKDGMLRIMKPESVNEVGCIHTCQGLEVDYVGVIIGPDLIVRNGEVLVDPSQRATTDASLKGYKKALKENPEETKDFIKSLIKNTYRTLMTRGMKGCYIYCTDEETREYFKKLIG